MLKRMISFLLVLVLVFAMLPAVSIAAEVYTGDYIAVVNTNLDAETLYEGTATAREYLLSRHGKKQEMDDIVACDIYVDEETGKTVRILAPELEELVPVEEVPSDDILSSVQVIPDLNAYYAGYKKEIVDSTTSSSQSIRCLYEGEYCTVWGSTTDSSAIRITSEHAKEIADEFDSKCQNAVDMFGSWYDVDNDNKVAILCYDIEQNYGETIDYYTQGYFHSANMLDSSSIINGIQFEDSDFGLKMDCIHIDTYPGMGEALDNISNVYSTLFHEFQHMIQFSYSVKDGVYKDGMPVFLNEAFSMAAEHLICGPDTTESYIDFFNSEDYLVGSPLTYWAGIMSNYANSYLFGQYIRTRYAQCGNGDGSSLYHTILETMSDSGEDAMDILADLLNTTPQQLVKDFWTAIVCMYKSGKYGFNGENWANGIYFWVCEPEEEVCGVYNGGVIYYDLNGAAFTVTNKMHVEVVCIDDWNVTGTEEIANDFLNYMDVSAKEVLQSNNEYPWGYCDETQRMESSNQGVSNSSSMSTLTFTSDIETEISFQYGVSSETGYDKLFITLDDTNIVSGISGSRSGSFNKTLSAGEHTLTFQYTKDGSGNKNSDLAWVSDLVILGGCTQHTKTEIKYFPNGDETHQKQTVCAYCGIEMAETVLCECIDENIDFCCDFCGGTVSCKHNTTSVSEQYVPNLDGTHTKIVTTNCYDCGVKISETSETSLKCTDTNDDDACDWCSGNANWCFDQDTGVLYILDDKVMTDYQYSSHKPWDNYKSKITKVVIGDGVTVIGDYAFYEYNIKSLVISNTVKSIGDYAFYDCNMETVTIPDSVTGIGGYAFASCETLLTVSLGDGLKSISASFIYCSGLTHVDIPNSVTHIDSYAFAHCSALTEVAIGDGLTYMGMDAFYDCGSLKEISVSGKNKNFCDSEGVLFDKEKTELLCYPAGKTQSKYEIPYGVTTISRHAFYNCDSLISVTIPDSVTDIGVQAFDNCSSLVSMEIPDSVQSIGAGVFEECEKLTEILVSVGNANYCDISGVLFNKKMTELIYYPIARTDTAYCVPDGVQIVGRDAFMYCNNLAQVTFPSSVQIIDAYAFWECTALSELKFSEGLETIGYAAFYYCQGLKALEIPDSVTSIGGSAFSGCRALSSLQIGDGVQTIGTNAFLNCAALTDVYYYGTEEQWDAITIDASGNSSLTDALRHYMSLEYRNNGDGSHTAAYICSEHGETWNETAEKCADNNSDGLCDLCSSDMSLCHIRIGTAVKEVSLTNSTYPWRYHTSSGRFESTNKGISSSFGTLTIQFTATEEAEISFDYGVSSESGYDKLTITLDGVAVVNGISGIKSGSFSKQLSTGKHTVVFKYTKDSYTNSNSDLAWFSNLEIKACSHLQTKTDYVFRGEETHTKKTVCADCGEVLSEFVEDCDDKDNDSICDHCGFKMAIEVIKFTIPGCAPNLESELEMGIAIPNASIPDGVEFTAVVTQTSGGEVVNTFEIPQTEWTEYTAALDMVYVKMAAKCMADEFSIEVVDEAGNVWNEPYITSYRAYVMNNFDKGNDARKTLFVDMLNYGAAAQTRFSYNTDDLANKGLTAKQQEYSLGAISLQNKQLMGSKNIGSSASLESRILVYSYFKDIVDPAGMYATVNFTDARGIVHTEEIPGTSFELYNAAQKAYKICVDNLVPADVDVAYTMIVYNADGSVYDIAVDGLGSYLSRNGGKDPVFDAVATFGMAARQYFVGN